MWLLVLTVKVKSRGQESLRLRSGQVRATLGTPHSNSRARTLLRLVCPASRLILRGEVLTLVAPIANRILRLNPTSDAFCQAARKIAHKKAGPAGLVLVFGFGRELAQDELLDQVGECALA